jgi:hypothetical protein
VAMRRVADVERRARVGVRQGLTAGARLADAVGVARAVVALHSTDPASVYLSVWARLAPGATDPARSLETALYEQRSLVRMLGMRRTVFVVPTDLVPVVHSSSTKTIAATERRKLHALLVEGGVTADPAGWLAEVEAATRAALAARGEALATELSADVPGLREQVTLAPGKAYEAVTRLSSRVLLVLAADGRIVRGRPRGSWLSSQYRWAPIESWLPGGLPDMPDMPARVELVRRWLAQYGPGTVADLKWWTGWTVAQVKAALAVVRPVEVELAGGGTGLLLAEDADPVEPPEPAVNLLPSLDPSVMGWSGRDWYLGDYGPELFDRSGNPGPTVWWGGRIVGGWAQRANGEVVHHLFEDIGAEADAAVAAEADRLTRWFGDARVTPRFRTPLERKLIG